MTSVTFPFPPAGNMIMACHITGVYDVNRNMTLEVDNYELVRDWAESVTAANLRGLIFHNSFSLQTCNKFENDNIVFIKIDYNPKFNPNVFRYFVYRDFLDLHGDIIKNIFITDISDVVLLKNPFTDPYFIQHASAIFCGDEPKNLDNDWMRAHSAQLRERITDYAEYETRFASETLLNCGVIGAATPILKNFLEKLCAIHLEFNFDNKTPFTGDMGAFNYLVRTHFNSQVRHGAPINTLFKRYETERSDCWFRHK